MNLVLQKRTTTMSQLSADQTQGNEPLDGDASSEPNGLDDANQHTDNAAAADFSIDFGVFNGKVQNEVGRFQDAIGIAHDAASKLATTFRQHGEMVQFVDERQKKYQELEEEIRELKAATREMWRHRDEDALKVKELEEDARAGEIERLHYESLSTHLKDDFAKKEQKMKQKSEEEARQVREEFENKRAQLEADHTEKIAALEEQKTELENTNAKLKQDLDTREKELELEKESSKRLQESLRLDIGRLKGELNDIEAKYAAEEQSPEY
jgi:chromosome segregation ATPase